MIDAVLQLSQMAVGVFADVVVVALGVAFGILIFERWVKR